jgi:hypothetical protein
MAKRLIRSVPLIRGLAPIAQSVARGMSQSNQGFANRQPATIPQGAYTGQQETVIVGGYAAVVVSAGGTATAKVGPAGVGTVWYPQAAAISTTTGANDASTCALYLTPLENGPQVPSTQIGGQSYAGGGDTIGLAVPPMWPGYFIVAVWAGGTAGDLASLAVYGTQRALVA